MKVTYRKSWPEALFQLLTFTFDYFFNVKRDYLTTTALYLLYFSIITDPGDNHCSSGLVFDKMHFVKSKPCNHIKISRD